MIEEKLMRKEKEVSKIVSSLIKTYKAEKFPMAIGAIIMKTAELESCSSGSTRLWLLTLAARRVAGTHIIESNTFCRIETSAAGNVWHDQDESSIYGFKQQSLP